MSQAPAADKTASIHPEWGSAALRNPTSKEVVAGVAHLPSPKISRTNLLLPPRSPSKSSTPGRFSACLLMSFRKAGQRWMSCLPGPCLHLSTKGLYVVTPPEQCLSLLRMPVGGLGRSRGTVLGSLPAGATHFGVLIARPNGSAEPFGSGCRQLLAPRVVLREGFLRVQRARLMRSLPGSSLAAEDAGGHPSLIILWITPCCG